MPACSRVRLFATRWTWPARLSVHGVFRKSWSRLPFPFRIFDPGLNPHLLCLHCIAGEFFTHWVIGKLSQASLMSIRAYRYEKQREMKRALIHQANGDEQYCFPSSFCPFSLSCFSKTKWKNNKLWKKKSSQTKKKKTKQKLFGNKKIHPKEKWISVANCGWHYSLKYIILFIYET